MKLIRTAANATSVYICHSYVKSKIKHKFMYAITNTIEYILPFLFRNKAATALSTPPDTPTITRLMLDILRHEEQYQRKAILKKKIVITGTS